MTKDQKDCLFCLIRKGELPCNLIYYDKLCYVILDIFPSQKGHMLVISREHHDNLLATPEKLADHMLVIARKFARKSKKKLKATAVKIVINTGKDAGQLVPHTHVHVIPHYYPVTSYNVHPNKKLTEKEAKRLLKILSEVNNAHAFQSHNLDI